MQRIFIGEDLGFFSQSLWSKLEILWWKTLEFDIGEMNHEVECTCDPLPLDYHVDIAQSAYNR
jgi:hypothetical protein